MRKKEELFEKLAKAMIDCNMEAAKEVAKEILAAGVDPIEAIQRGAVKGLDIVGQRYQRLEAFLPELVLAADTMKACLAILSPHISAERVGEISLGKVVIGTVSGDVHDIGKNMVAAMLGVTGFEVYDLGVDVAVKRFIEKTQEVKANVIALSALMSTSAYYQEEVIKYLKDTGQRQNCYVVVGGGPITPEWATRIGADGYAKTAIGASQLLKKLVSEKIPPPLSEPLIIEQ